MHCLLTLCILFHMCCHHCKYYTACVIFSFCKPISITTLKVLRGGVESEKLIYWMVVVYKSKKLQETTVHITTWLWSKWYNILYLWYSSRLAIVFYLFLKSNDTKGTRTILWIWQSCKHQVLVSNILIEICGYVSMIFHLFSADETLYSAADWVSKTHRDPLTNRDNWIRLNALLILSILDFTNFTCGEDLNETKYRICSHVMWLCL